MWRTILVAVILSVLLLPVFSDAVEDKNPTWNEFDGLAGQLLQQLKQGDIDDAKQTALVLSDEMDVYPFSEEEWTLSSMRTLVTTFESAYDALFAEDVTVEEQVRLAMALRLSTDAVQQVNQPLWNQMDRQLLDSLDRISAVNDPFQSQQYMYEVNRTLQLYDTVRPAVLISKGYEQVSELDAMHHKLQEQQLSQAEIDNHLDVMRHEYLALFAFSSVETVDPGLYVVMFIIGTPVFLTLSYVGFRKFKGQRKKVKQNE
ncbi:MULTISPECIES: sporulation protein YpjB [Shouchella]|uniref:Sporulation protein YpjB n=1 Tax=Shouchella hunanensis TaxID=766894 RepID=A0ABY7W3K5_9BACI|nr:MULTISPECIES: sporulation protein YpjB [Shouchella]WDF03542.1 sporulation protein YpjB [Shouchella hunanensis]